MSGDNKEDIDSDNFSDISIKIKNYMCFLDAPQGFESIKPVNIIIGRNNSGKSRLMDMLEFASSSGGLGNAKAQTDVEILLSIPLIESELRAIFPENTSGGIIGGNHWDFGKNYVGNKITISISRDPNNKFVSLDPGFGREDLDEYEAKLARRVRNPFSNKIIKKITAERDVVPEGEVQSADLRPNGRGATSILELILNNDKYKPDIVRNDLLNELNRIVSPDMHFESIIVRRLEDRLWEVILEERGKGQIRLSNSGSGLKTILLVLINTILLPKYENKELNNYIFVFEELENNLHPAIQRRLLSYIREVAVDNGTIFFITTHSNVVIDLFSKDANAQIYHVVQKAGKATAEPVTTYMKISGIIDDLDIRASDLLQSNGIIWVEGPSDRVYINRFIELWSKGTIREGLHYQCVYYGGRVLAHFSADMDINNQKNLLNILLVNRNAILVMDSDRNSEREGVNATKERIGREIDEAGGLFWITAGRTIENYIPQTAMTSLYNFVFARELDRFENYQRYLEEFLPSNYEKYYKNKVSFAERIRAHLTREDLEKSYDLSSEMPKIIDEVNKWNRTN